MGFAGEAVGNVLFLGPVVLATRAIGSDILTCLKKSSEDIIGCQRMGIPSYYKRLIDRFPRLVEKGVKQLKTDILMMDFNCLIYQCVRAESLPVYTAATRETWETALLEAVKEYTVRVWTVAGRPATVFIGVDGVVPMAKIRQQRLRRFKSRWLAAAEAEAGARKPGEEVWDTNAITPGTAFMEKLARALHGLAAARGPGWTVSAADEPGEGEQKLMAWMRQQAADWSGKNVAVYGLDADLIVLSLLGLAREAAGVASWKLLRELAEFEGGKSGAAAAAGAFGSLNIRELLGLLVPEEMSPAEYMQEYVCGMSFLGNDFLPHSLSVKIREGGHDVLCRALSEIHTGGQRLTSADGHVLPAGCLQLVQRLGLDEEAAIADSFKHKYEMRPQPPRNDKERLLSRLQNMPIELRAESALWSKAGGLVPEWRGIYREKWLHGADADQTCGEYIRGLQWILDYYLGKPVSYSWYFPWNLPPLWSDLAGEFSKVSVAVAPPVSAPVAPQEQLAMVLPMDSWWLVRDKRLRVIPLKAPIFWPTKFGFFSVGRRFMWECEAEIPVISVERLHTLLK